MVGGADMPVATNQRQRRECKPRQQRMLPPRWMTAIAGPKEGSAWEEVEDVQVVLGAGLVGVAWLGPSALGAWNLLSSLLLLLPLEGERYDRPGK